MNDETDNRALGMEFETDSGEYWRVDRFDKLMDEFSLEVSDLTEWHRFMAGKGLAWEAVSRLCQVGSMLEPDADILRPWTKAEIGKKYGVPVAQVEMEISVAVKQWKLSHARTELGREADTGVGEDEIDRLTRLSSGSDIDDVRVDQLLAAFDFKDVRDPMQRIRVAKRILSLKDYLASPHTRTPAREIIRFEITMHGLEKILATYNNKIDELTERDPTRSSTGTEVDVLAEKAQALDKQIRDIGAAHSKLQKAIGADDIDMTTRKRIFVETVAYIQEVCRIYESDPENARADGVFRVGEIDWLLEPVGDRGPQYRPDAVTRLKEALAPENLWDPEYVPTKLSIRVCQELRKIVEGLRGIPEDAPPLNEMDGDDDVAEPTEGVDVPVDDGEVATAGAPAFGAQRQESASCMGVF